MLPSVTLQISAADDRVDMRLAEDDSGMLYLQTWPSGVAIYSMQGVLDIGWKIVEADADERLLLKAHGFEAPP